MKPAKFVSLLSSVFSLSILLCPKETSGRDWDGGDHYSDYGQNAKNNGFYSYYYDNGSSSGAGGGAGTAGTGLALKRQDSLLDPARTFDLLTGVSLYGSESDLSLSN